MTSFPRLRFIPVTEEVVVEAQRLVGEYELAPRDAIHCASALKRQLQSLLSDDKDFDVVGEIRRYPFGTFQSTGKS